jgi:hypothetical protein
VGGCAGSPWNAIYDIFWKTLKSFEDLYSISLEYQEEHSKNFHHIITTTQSIQYPHNDSKEGRERNNTLLDVSSATNLVSESRALFNRFKWNKAKDVLSVMVTILRSMNPFLVPSFSMLPQNCKMHIINRKKIGKLGCAFVI